MNLDGRHVVITGASRGLGAALADQFAAKGARLTVVARTVSGLEDVAAHQVRSRHGRPANGLADAAERPPRAG
jgi:NAD(P)-dependent dehydrogenase (short-subunit alcohol dehydrogenase family)